MASIFKQALGDISGGVVLDVATGRGGSIGILKRNLKGYELIIGIDKSEVNIRAALKSKGEEDTAFIRMEAEHQGFTEGSFDVVFISNSLHHLPNIEQVLFEMKRVLKTGGKLIISEPHRDTALESQLTNIHLHHWIADIDTSLGYYHDRTFTRQAILDHAHRLELSGTTIYDRVTREKDPFAEKTIRRYEEYFIERFLQRAKEAPDAQKLVQQGGELRSRLHEVGIQTQEPLILIVGEKS